jgi:hypothetical protein
MPFNGSGVFQRVRNWVADATAGIKIRADYHDAEDDGFAQGLTNCITKDGQTLITQNIPFNSKRITGLADPVNPQDAGTKAYADTKVSNIGGVMTNNLTIKGTTPILSLDAIGDPSFGSQINSLRNSKVRWIMRPGNADVESGSNAGSNFDLLRYADDGTTQIGSVMTVSRATGDVTFGDIIAQRNATEGVIFLGSDKAGYLHRNGTSYVMPNGKLILGAPGAVSNDAVTWDQLATKQNALGFTPVRQGGGAGQLSNTVFIGWDNSNLRAQVDSTDLGPIAFGASVVKDGRLAFAGQVNVATGPQNTILEPYPGAVITGWVWATVTVPIVSAFRLRYMQLQTAGGWYTVGYV